MLHVWEKVRENSWQISSATPRSQLVTELPYTKMALFVSVLPQRKRAGKKRELSALQDKGTTAGRKSEVADHQVAREVCITLCNSCGWDGSPTVHAM